MRILNSTVCRVVLFIAGCLSIGVLAAACGSASAAAPATPTPSPTPSATSATTVNIIAHNIAFDLKTTTIPAGKMITVHMTNNDFVPHNFAVYTRRGGTQLFAGPIFTGPHVTRTFTSKRHPSPAPTGSSVIYTPRS